MNAVLTGLPLTGKTCLFDALCGGAVDSAAHPARADQPNAATVALEDERLDWLMDHYQAKKRTPVHIEVLDVPGLAPGQSDLAARNTAVAEHLRRADVLVEVLRAFESMAAPHPMGSVDPVRDRELIRSEFLIADLDITLRRIEKLEVAITKPTPEREALKRELDLMRRVRETLEAELPLSAADLSEAERRLLRSFAFLTEKPRVTVLNVGEDEAADPAAAARFPDLPAPDVALVASLEAEIGQLPPEDRPAFMEEMGIARFHTQDVLQAVYRALDRVTFFTAGEPEVAARSVVRGTGIAEAAGEIHTDMAKGFIRAEVVSFDDFKAAGSLAGARTAGRHRVEGRDYAVREGDIVLIHFSR